MDDIKQGSLRKTKMKIQMTSVVTKMEKHGGWKGENHWRRDSGIEIEGATGGRDIGWIERGQDEEKKETWKL